MYWKPHLCERRAEEANAHMHLDESNRERKKNRMSVYSILFHSFYLHYKNMIMKKLEDFVHGDQCMYSQGQYYPAVRIFFFRL